MFQRALEERTTRAKELTMAGLATQLYSDERGVILSAEIVLVMTVGILSMIVGLHFVAQAVSKHS